MAKDPKTVVDDIYAVLQEVIDGNTVEIPDEVFVDLGASIASSVKRALTARNNDARKTKTLYMSEFGRPCRRQLWYDIRPEYKSNKEKLTPPNIIKFLYGDILEDVVLALAELAGHEVTDQQKSCEVELPFGWKLRGRMDAKIDGEIVDVKSTTTHGFKKFTEGKLVEDDPFGYISQLGAYNDAEYDDNVPVGTTTSFLAIDKQLGHLCRMGLTVSEENDRASVEDERTQLVMDLENVNPPERAFKEVPEGKSGNMKLPTGCAYCGFKEECWKDANDGDGLRTFIYSKGPVFLTKVVKEPKVNEAK